MSERNTNIKTGEHDGLTTDDTSLVPSDTADPQLIVDRKIPADMRAKYDFFSYRNAAVILSETREPEWAELIDALRQFSITSTMIRMAGGNESEMPKLVTDLLRPNGWYETTIQGDLLIKLTWKEEVRRTKAGKPVFKKNLVKLDESGISMATK